MHTRSCAVAINTMGDRDDKKKLQGGLNFTKAMPNFMAKMAGGTSGSAPDLGGIEGAMQRHAARTEEEREEREDNEDEAPIVVDAAEALTAKERKKLEAKQPSSAKLGGSLRFKELYFLFSQQIQLSTA